MRKLISPSLSPNLELSDVLLALKAFLYPLSLKSGEYSTKVESWFRYNFSVRNAFTFASAREAEYAVLYAAGIGAGDEVLIQAFTCAAVVYPILWLGAKPVYVDINRETLSMDPGDIKKKITKKTKAIIVQHTFGIPGPVEEVKEIARKNKILSLEDCAHVINGTYKNKKLGTFLDGAFFSLGRDKAVSSVFGGVLITNKNRLAQNVVKLKNFTPYPTYLWIVQQLLHMPLTYIVLFLYSVHPTLGKGLLYALKKLHIISRPIIASYESTEVKSHVKKYPNALAMVGYSQLLKINRFNKKRVDLYEQYKKQLRNARIRFSLPKASYLRIPLLIRNRNDFIQLCRAELVYIGDWYSKIIDPGGESLLTHLGYKKGSCKVAERVSYSIINLPCYPNMTYDDVEVITRLLKKHYGKV